MKHTLNTAAKLSGRAKSTISKAIKDGRLSATKNDKGGFEIDGSELARVFPFPAPDQSQVPASNTVNEQENKALETEVKLLREQLADRDDTISDLRVRLDRESEERRNLTAMIAAPHKAENSPSRSFLGLFRRVG